MRVYLKTSLLVLTLCCLSTSTVRAFTFSDNFDSYASLSGASANWDYVPSTGVTLDATGGVSGTKALKFVYSGEQFFPLEKNIHGANLDHVYTKFNFKAGSPAPVGGIKFMKIFGGGYDAGGMYANWTWNFGPTTADTSSLTALCYGEGSGLQNDTNVCIYPDGSVNGPAGSVVLSELKGSLFYPVPGQWYEVTTYNRYSTNGASDGEMWIAIDGKAILHVKNAKNRNDSNPRVIDKLSFGDYANRNAKMTIWFDNIQLSDSPFTGSAIPAPSGLKVINKTP